MMTALYFDPERDALVCDSPKMEPRRPNLEPSPSPPPYDIPRSQVSPPSSPQNQTGRPLARQKSGPVPAQGDAVLISFLDNGRRPDLARLAATEGLPSDDEDDEPPKGVAVVEDSRAQLNSQAQLAALAAGALNLGVKQEPAVPTEPAVDTFVVPLPVERNGFPMANGKETSQSELLESHLSSPPAVNGSHVSPLPAIKTNDELAPIQQPSPKSDKMNGNVTLPSISSTLGALGGLDLKQLAEAATNITTSKTSDNELRMEHRHSFSQSPPGPPPLFSTLHHSSVSGNVSPPMSPNESFRRELPSPSRRSISTTASPQYTFGHQFRRPSTQADTTSPYSSTADTPSTSTDQSTPGSIPIDRMSIDGITNPQVGGFQCTYPSCNAAPFQTQVSRRRQTSLSFPEISVDA